MRAKLWKQDKIIEKKRKIYRLFEKSYDEEIDANKFYQLYKYNPFGQPRAIALRCEESLAGYYGLVPQKLTLQEENKKEYKNYLLGTTLMVLPEYRGMAALSKIMERVSKYLENSKYEFLLGFPNEESFIPLSRLFGWEVIIDTQFFECDLSGSDALEKKIYETRKRTNKIGWSVPYENEKFMEWKSMCKNYKLVSIGDRMQVAYKDFDNKRLDVVDILNVDNATSPKESLKSLGNYEDKSKILITGHHAELIGLDKNDLSIWSNYKIRLCSPNKNMVPNNLNFSMLMSDVF